MALKIRLQRHGTSHRPFYRMVVAEANARRDGRFVELLGTYEPQASRPEDELNLKLERIDYWKSVGAKATDTANSLVRKARREQEGSVSVEESVETDTKIKAAVEAEAEIVAESTSTEDVPTEAENSDNTAEEAAEETADACSLDSSTPSEKEAVSEEIAEDTASSETDVS